MSAEPSTFSPPEPTPRPPSTDLIVRSAQPLTKEQVQFIAHTEFVPKHYRGKIAEMFACILTGRALGLDDLHSLRSIYVVDGKPTLSAELMVALARRAGHSISGESTAEQAIAHGKRADNGDEFTVSFTIEEARAIPAKENGRDITLAEKRVWKAYPADMLWARAVSRLCRRLFPDVLAGVSYTPDEAELSPEERNMEATGDLPLPPDEGSLIEADGERASSGRKVEAFGVGNEPVASASVSEASGPSPSDLAAEQEDGAQIPSGPEGQTSLAIPDVVRRQMESGE